MNVIGNGLIRSGKPCYLLLEKWRSEPGRGDEGRPAASPAGRRSGRFPAPWGAGEGACGARGAVPNVHHPTPNADTGAIFATLVLAWAVANVDRQMKNVPKFWSSNSIFILGLLLSPFAALVLQAINYKSFGQRRAVGNCICWLGVIFIIGVCSTLDSLQFMFRGPLLHGAPLGCGLTTFWYMW
jgi:hypothetical protein